MDLKQALQQRGGGNASNNNVNITSNNSKSSANSSVQSDGGCNNSSCSNTTGESNRGSSPAPTPLSFSGAVSMLNGSNSNSINPHLAGGRVRELDAALDPRLLKLARMHEPVSSSPHLSSTLETQVLFNLNGSFNNSSGNNMSSNNLSNNVNAGQHHGLASYLSSSNQSSNHGSPTSNYAGTCSMFNGGGGGGGGSPHMPKLYPYVSIQEDPPMRQHHSPFMLSAVPAPQASLLSAHASRLHHLASLQSCFNPEPVASVFTSEQLLEFTQQTYVFKHFVAGVTPPPTLLLPIINSVASMARIGVGSMHYGGNAGLFGVGGLRGNIDPEPGRCRRTDGKKWRCAREVVADQKYCERHMHRGRHRARANKLANGGTDTFSNSTSLPSNVTMNTSNVHSNSGISSSVTATFDASTPKEPHLHFSLQPASAVLKQINRSSSDGHEKQPFLSSSSSDGGLKRLLQSNNMGGPLSRNIAAQPENPPNLAELLNANPSKSSLTNQHKSQHNNIGLDSPFPFACQTASDREADNSTLRQFGDDHWPRISRVADNPPASLSWFEQLSEEQNKRTRFNTELSIATHKSPLSNLSAKYDGSQQEDLVGGVDASHFMGLGMDVGSKVSGIAKLEEDRYSGRSTWVPIAWESPAIGGPLGEVLQSNAANSGGSFGGSLANNGGERCLNLIEEDSWVHQEGGQVSSPAKDSHSPSMASPTGVLQIKASFGSYSDSSSSASSPRAALKLDSSANLGI